MANTRKKTFDMVIAALLIAISIMIPMYFGFLSIRIEPFTATITAHVPMFIAMMISPATAAVVGLGSAMGFFLAGYGPVVTARATSHIVWGFTGGYLLKKKMAYVPAVLISGVVHALYEGLIIIPFLPQGKATTSLIAITTIGTFIHHCVDASIAYLVAMPLEKALRKDLIKRLI